MRLWKDRPKFCPTLFVKINAQRLLWKTAAQSFGLLFIVKKLPKVSNRQKLTNPVTLHGRN
jgi:hypothetical protein